MDVFFRQLCLKLDNERPNWRKDTVILLDNAPYHACNSTIKLLEGLGFTVLFTGPHSYDASPTELLFARFKACDFNPNRIPTDKT